MKHLISDIEHIEFESYSAKTVIDANLIGIGGSRRFSIGHLAEGKIHTWRLFSPIANILQIATILNTKELCIVQRTHKHRTRKQTEKAKRKMMMIVKEKFENILYAERQSKSLSQSAVRVRRSALKMWKKIEIRVKKINNNETAITISK